MSDQNNFDTDEHLKEIINDIKENKLEDALEKIKQHLHNVETIPLNIAITGESGTGKSTFINAIRGLQDGDDGAAATGGIETTDKPTPYPHPYVNNVTYWDLPGIGTPKFHAATYLEDVNFKRYDFFIILASERFTENDVLLAKVIHDMKKNFYFVRSKIDNDISASKHRKRPDTEEDILKRIREDCFKNLKEAGIENPRVFLISSFYPGKFDFTRLLENLNKDLPGEKRSVLLRALPNISYETIQAKKQELSNQVALVGIAIYAGSAIPLPFVGDLTEKVILVSYINKYLQDFGLDAGFLENLAKQSSKTVSKLKGLMKSAFVKNEVTLGLVQDELEKREGITYMKLKTVSSLGCFLNLIVSGPMSAAASCRLLHSVLEEFAEDAVSVLQHSVLEEFAEDAEMALKVSVRQHSVLEEFAEDAEMALKLSVQCSDN